jgi:hypothetical protein
MTLQPFVGPWPLLQFRNLLHIDGRAPWTSDQPVARPLPTYRTTQTQNKRSHTPNIHALSGIRTPDPSIQEIEYSSYLKPRGHCDRQFQVVLQHYYGGTQENHEKSVRIVGFQAEI